MSKTNSTAGNAASQFDKFFKETADFGSQYSEACTKSSTIFMKGMEDIMGAVMSIAQSSAEKQAAFMKEAMGTKNINDFAEIQNKIAQSSFDEFMSNATKISEIGVKVLTESAEPVNVQMQKAMEKATSMAA